ncbi:PhpK family radical SAM P-methyltransferase [Streptomyces sp. NBC_00669]|uniref:PhpK family radical SAM P-methyltransferase n=1 Tax=Streptomyces sp. NBC_00669 TaxID=2976011 RepID=UPI002E380CD4|nr:PhpK family radical SAM P-methyltransferase [Streptomyces sp. NBC_00669]
MNSSLDCMVIGYNDPPLSFHEHRLMAQEPKSPERRVFMREHLLVDGARLAPMDVINHYAERFQPVGADPYYHVGEVPNLAAVYLTSYLRRQGFDAEYISLFRPETSRLEEVLEHRRPKVVAITTTFYLMPWPVHEICRFVRERYPEAHVVVGGPLVDNLANDLSAEALTTVFEWVGADSYIRESQGEESLGRLVSAVRQGTEPSDVPNLYTRADTGFRFTRTRPEANSLDACAIDWGLCDRSELGATVQTRTARSCAFKCSFCDFPVRAGALSVASVETVERELRQLADLGTRHLVFVDDTFNVPIGRFKELCRMMIRNDFPFEWYSFFRCSAARDTEIFDLMWRSGCRAVFLGIETGDDSVLRNMVKSSSGDQYRFAMEQLHARGIATFASFICGFPGETEQTVRNTVDFINETQPTFYRSELWFYNHRSPIHQQAETFGITGQGYDWSHATMDSGRAADAADAVFREVTGSVWMPGYNYDFWAVPYLLGKGLTMAQLVDLHTTMSRLMAFNASPSTAPAEQARHRRKLEEWFRSVRMAPPRYRMAQDRSVSSAV